MSNRHLSRIIAMQTLFLWDFYDKKEENMDKIIKVIFLNFATKFNDNDFVKNIVYGIKTN